MFEPLIAATETEISKILAINLDGIGTLNDLLFKLILIVIIFIGARIAISLINRFIERSLKEHKAIDEKLKFDKVTLDTIKKIVRYFVYFIAFIMILGQFGLNITTLIAVLGIGGIAIAFGAQETIANILAGFVLILDKPFRVGDSITLAEDRDKTGDIIELERSGQVIDIGLRSTRIKTSGNVLVSIPNSEFSKREIWNYTRQDKTFKIFMPISISYESDYGKAKKILIEKAKKHSEVLKNLDAPEVIHMGFGEYSINMVLSAWIKDAEKRFYVRSDLFESIKEEFDKEGIEIPYPKRHLVFGKGEKLIEFPKSMQK
ncbi:MAG: mechanosensitive ion channel family protein [Candidatus Diapherotrites archaeon]